jgi:hypothetical protein
MAGGKDLSDLKQRLSARLLDEPGVSGVGLRGNRVVVYLEHADAAMRERIEHIARGVAADAPLLFEVSGPFRKQ